MWVYHDFFVLPGTGSTFTDVDPDPVKWNGYDRIKIRNTAQNNAF